MERVKQYFISRNGAFLLERIHVFSESSATVELAAQCLNCEPAHIAKSLSFFVKIPRTNAANKQKQKQKNANLSGEDSVGSPTASPTSPAEGNRGDHPIIIVAAGDAKVSTQKYKAKFSCSPKMFKREEVEEAVGHPAGGVCPFAVNPAVKVYLDVSLRRFEKVYPACGTSNTGISLSCEELETFADNFVEWVDLCEGWRETGEGAAKREENEAAKKDEA